VQSTLIAVAHCLQTAVCVTTDFVGWVGSRSNVHPCLMCPVWGLLPARCWWDFVLPIVQFQLGLNNACLGATAESSNGSSEREGEEGAKWSGSSWWLFMGINQWIAGDCQSFSDNVIHPFEVTRMVTGESSK